MRYKLGLRSSCLGLLTTLVLLSGCTQDYFTGEMAGDLNRIDVKLNMSGGDVVYTRNAGSDFEMSEYYISNGYILVFGKGLDAKAKVIYPIVIDRDILGNGTAKPKISAGISISQGDLVKFVFNIAPTDLDALSNVTWNTFNDHFNMGNKGFVLPYEAGKENGLPMYGDVPVWGSDVKTIPIKRQVAKIHVEIPAAGLGINDMTGAFNTTNVKFNLYNIAMDGAISSEDNVSFVPGVTGGDLGSSTLSLPLSSDNDVIKKVRYIYAFPYSKRYILETPSNQISENMPLAERFAVILTQATDAGPRYFRIDLCDQVLDGKPTYFDVNRNTHYKIKINKVISHGYGTVQEALDAPASNLEYNITANVGDQTISNGTYALGIDEGKDRADKLICRVNAVPLYLTIAELRYAMTADFTSVPKMTVTHSCTNPAITTTDNFTTDPNLSLKIDSPTDLVIAVSGNGIGTITTNIRFGDLTYTIETNIDKDVSTGFNGASFIVTGQIKENIDGVGGGLQIINNDDGTLTITVPVNSTPTSWELRDETGAYNAIPSGSENDVANYDAIPIYNGGVLNETILTTVGDKVIVMAEQSAPMYIGRWGSPINGAVDGVGSYDKLNTPKEKIGMPMRDRAMLADNNEKTFSGAWLTTGTVAWNSALHNDGRKHSINSGSELKSNALNACYKKNIGYIEGAKLPDEKVIWYLPAIYQLEGVWVSLASIGYTGEQSFGTATFWSSTTGDANTAKSSDFKSGKVKGLGVAEISHSIRCIRDLPSTTK